MPSRSFIHTALVDHAVSFNFVFFLILSLLLERRSKGGVMRRTMYGDEEGEQGMMSYGHSAVHLVVVGAGGGWP